MEERGIGNVLRAVAAEAGKAGEGAAEPAEYRVEHDAQGKLWVSLVTANRWLSESIETDLLHTGDKIEELLDDELVEVGFDAGPLKVEHFRSEDLLFTFRTAVPAEHQDEAATASLRCLLAYEACFRQLGDMSGEKEA
ncbi:MAG: hypothetical protein IPJ41_12675 [Phycisphaerales bacterium]|nr:hypothetical protein [Phycisphaerales bacterium]